MRQALIGVAGLLALAACEQPLKPPLHTGVCWRLAPAMNGAQDFKRNRCEHPTAPWGCSPTWRRRGSCLWLGAERIAHG